MSDEHQNKNRGLEECLNRFLGRCRGCQRDLDKNHHPNNYDCPLYTPFKIIIFNVLPDDKRY